MKCKHCDNEYEAKRATSQYCSAACRVKASRVSVTNNTEVSVTELSVTPSLEHYQANPDQYATRANPDMLNWGKPMSMRQLKQAGLKANRVPIPGDHDYKGVCEQVDGVWQVRA